jgi:hypothetical protein
MSEQRPRREIHWKFATLVGVLTAIGISNAFIPPNEHTSSAHPGVDTMPGFNGEYIPTDPQQENRFPATAKRVAAHVCSVVVMQRSSAASEGKHTVIVNPVLDTEVGTPATVSLDPSGITLSEGAKLDNYEVYNHQGDQTVRNRLHEPDCNEEQIRMVQVHDEASDTYKDIVVGEYSAVGTDDDITLNAHNAVRNQIVNFQTEMTNGQFGRFLAGLHQA